MRAGRASQAIDRWVNVHRDDAVQLTADLVRIPTENVPPDGNELQGQRFVARRLADLGAEIDLFELDEVPALRSHPAYWPGRNYKDRPNVVGRFRGSGEGKSLLFSSHMDTAARTPLPWHVAAPFEPLVREGRLFGRGAYDMKGGLAASLLAMQAVQASGIALRGDVLIESVVDEEWGGSNGTLAARLRGHAADACVVPEPSHMVLCPAHFGVRIFRVRVRGTPGMAWREELINPAYKLSALIEAINRYRAYRAKIPTPAIHAGVAQPPVDVMAVSGEGYGVPDECRMHFFVHCYEGETADSLVADLRAFLAAELSRNPFFAEGIPDIEPISRFLPGSSIPADHPVVACAQAACEEMQRPAVVQGAPFACDAYVFNQLCGIPALILGPGGGGAHSRDEYVLIDDLVDLVRIYARMIVAWCG